MDKLSAYDELKRTNDALLDDVDRLNGVIEDIRVARWHETYNAAIGRMPLNDIGLHDEGRKIGIDEERLRAEIDENHRIAVAQADRAHGPLKGGA